MPGDRETVAGASHLFIHERCMFGNIRKGMQLSCVVYFLGGKLSLRS